MVKVMSTATVAVTGNGIGDAKVTSSVTAKVMVKTTDDSSRDR